MRLKPDAYYRKIENIPWNSYIEVGITHILVDADNTLFCHGRYMADEDSIEIVRNIQKKGLKLILCSNAKKDRAKKIAETLGIDYIASCKKPSPDKINMFIKNNGLSNDEIIIVGDQYFTDVLAGKYAKIRTVLLKPRSKSEPWYICIKRIFEVILYFFMGLREFYDYIEK